MTRFLDKSFSVYSGSGQEYRDNWDAIFKKKETVSTDTPGQALDVGSALAWLWTLHETLKARDWSGVEAVVETMAHEIGVPLSDDEPERPCAPETWAECPECKSVTERGGTETHRPHCQRARRDAPRPSVEEQDAECNRLVSAGREDMRRKTVLGIVAWLRSLNGSYKASDLADEIEDTSLKTRPKP